MLRVLRHQVAQLLNSAPRWVGVNCGQGPSLNAGMRVSHRMIRVAVLPRAIIAQGSPVNGL